MPDANLGASVPRKSKAKAKFYPPFAKGHWFWGQRNAWRREPTRFPGELSIAHGGIVQYRVAQKRFVTLANAKFVREFMVKKQSKFQRGLFQKIMSQGLGRMLLTMDGSNWKERRRFLQPSFSSAGVAQQAQSAFWASKRLCARWRSIADGDQLPAIVHETRHSAMEAMFHMLFGVAPSQNDISMLVEAGKEMSIRTMQRSQRPSALFFNRVPKMARDDHEERNKFDLILKPFLERARSNPKLFRGTLVSHAVKAAQSNGFSEEQIWTILGEEVRGLFMAGYETTADTLAWLLYFLATHPKAAQKVFDETREFNLDDLVERSELNVLAYTEKCIHEALRLAPPVPLLGRVACENETLGGYHIPKGTTVQLSILGLHHNPHVWPDPEKFAPDRFEQNDPRLRDGNWIPFGFGPHLCIGLRAATNTLKIYLFNVLREFSLEFNEEAPLAQKLGGITAGPDREFNLVLRPRASRELHFIQLGGS